MRATRCGWRAATSNRSPGSTERSKSCAGLANQRAGGQLEPRRRSVGVRVGGEATFFDRIRGEDVEELGDGRVAQLPVAVAGGCVGERRRLVARPLPEPGRDQLRRVATQPGEEVDAVAGQTPEAAVVGGGEQRGYPVAEVGDRVVGAATGDPRRPAHDRRHADPSLVDELLAAGESEVVANRGLLDRSRPHPRPVVAGEEDEGVLEQAPAVQLVEQRGDTGVHALDHRHDRLQHGRAFPAAGAPDRVGRCLERSVRGGVGDGEEEPFVAVTADEAHRLVAEDVGQVPPVGGEGDSAALEVPVPVVLDRTAEADELGEAAVVRVVVATEGAAVPLADEAGDVAGFAEQVAERPLAERDAIRAAVRERVDHPTALRIPPGQEGRPGGRADRRRRVVLRQHRAVGRHRVDGRRARRPEVAAPEVAEAEVVGHHHDDVGRAHPAVLTRGPRPGPPRRRERGRGDGASAAPCPRRRGRRGGRGSLRAPSPSG